MNAIKHGYKCMNHVKIAPCNACNFLLMNVECFLYIATLAIYSDYDGPRWRCLSCVQYSSCSIIPKGRRFPIAVLSDMLEEWVTLVRGILRTTVGAPYYVSRQQQRSCAS